eukprot:CAMPEP_0174586760 /NCGR_PEP_ID=MMETSP0929-20130131/28065_1 /TAXON_ID=548131 ORGANISM="Ostreococcus mediterraneus, Strain clade-D-RCC2572" /NCGR_SAMPLE_ID=MMETSP0929 /ASSEMBLY_ACC=CAM_ASM_000573 /LENGTH=677 /DNA_ID=CAMNT_0015768785 /DNA_START=104 /DNA_END=2137 /DNA_ORIENTATION=-
MMLTTRRRGLVTAVTLTWMIGTASGTWTDHNEFEGTWYGDSTSYGYTYAMRESDGKYVVGYQSGDRVDFFVDRNAGASPGASVSLTPPSPTSQFAYGSSFGATVDIHNGWLIVGEPTWASGSSVNPPEGRAVIYEIGNSGTVSTTPTILRPATPASYNGCGSAVRTVGDMAVFKCDNPNGPSSSIHIFEYASSAWSETQVITATGPTSPGEYPISIDIVQQPTGTSFLAIGDASRNTHGQVQIYQRTGATLGSANGWTLLQTINSPSLQTSSVSGGVGFGYSLYFDDNYAYIGAPHDNDGSLGSSVYIFKWDVASTSYTQRTRLTVPSGYRIGTFGAINGLAGFLAAYYTNTQGNSGIFVFERDGISDTWNELIRINKPYECDTNYGSFGGTGDGAIALDTTASGEFQVRAAVMGCSGGTNSALSPQPSYTSQNTPHQPGSIFTYNLFPSAGGGGGGPSIPSAVTVTTASLSAAVSACFAENAAGNCQCSGASCGDLSGPISQWSFTGTNLDMGSLFEGRTTFNQPVGSWDVSGATSMKKMFKNASSFNQPIGGWDTSSVIDMTEMFAGATAFARDISGWDVDQVTTYTDMFDGADAFNAKYSCTGPKCSGDPKLGLTDAQTAGVAVGCIAFVVVLIIIVCIRQRRRNREKLRERLGLSPASASPQQPQIIVIQQQP